ncbi:hypothetical protein FOA52_012878 [Chlamydomonas sp. UWO 241]|nr:hypothetical protein FOA52_012878 [Chlamydomonas sp. UWO 241]
MTTNHNQRGVSRRGDTKTEQTTRSTFGFFQKPPQSHLDPIEILITQATMSVSVEQRKRPTASGENPPVCPNPDIAKLRPIPTVAKKW